MKKIIGIAVIIIIVFVASAPFVNGLILERSLRNAQGNMNKMYADYGSGVTIEIVQYDRKYGSSDIEWALKLGNMSAIYGIEEVVFVDRAKHGLTGIISTTSLEKNPWFSKIIDVYLDGNNPLKIITKYTVGGNIESTVDISAFSMKVENDTIDFRPAKIVTEIDLELTHLNSDGSWEGFSVSDQLKIDEFSFVYDLEKISTFIWAGIMSFEVENVTITAPNKSMEMTNLKSTYTLDYNPEKKTLSNGGTLTIDNLASGLDRADKISAEIELANIDAGGYEEFFKLYSQTMYSMMNDYNTAIGDPANMNDAVKRQIEAAGLNIMVAFEKLLTKGLEFKISNLHAQMPQGDINGDMVLKLTQDATFAQLTPIIMDPNLVLNFIYLQSNLSFPAALAPNPAMLISPIYEGMQTGLFVQNGNDLVHNAQTKDGRLFLNGQEFRFN